MSVTRHGDAGPEFGLVAETTGWIQEFNQKRAWDEATVENEIGEVITLALFNPRYEGSITLIAMDGGTIPSAGAVATIANLQTITKAILTELDRKPEIKGFTKYTFAYRAYDSMVLP